jgi:hypothetical protein
MAGNISLAVLFVLRAQDAVEGIWRAAAGFMVVTNPESVSKSLMNQTSVKLNFDALRNGHLGISVAYGQFLAEAAFHCFHFSCHGNPVLLSITGTACMSADLTWSNGNLRYEGTWSDLQEATKYGAYGVGIVIALHLTNSLQVERSAKNTGIDYWVGTHSESSDIFQRTARLEI